jgi:hypothetical protein
MVLDGADNGEVFFGDQEGDQEGDHRVKYVPQTSRGQVLITSRDDGILSLAAGQLVSPVNGIRVGPMSVHDGSALFQNFIPRGYRTLREQILAPQGTEFLTMLGGLPLAIVQASSYMIAENISIQEFIDLYREVEGKGDIFGKSTMNIDREVISVLRT